MEEKTKFERFFVEIPIYRCSEAAHYTQTRKMTDDYLSGGDWIKRESGWLKKAGLSYDEAKLRQHAERFYRKFPANEGLARGDYAQRHCFSWHYNQVIGWLRLYVLGTQIRGKVYFVKAKRISLRMKNRCYFAMGKAFELSTYPSQSSNEIYELILEMIAKLNKERPFKGRYIDLECFQGVGPYIDWRSLMGYTPQHEITS